MDDKIQSTGTPNHPGYETSDAEVKPVLGFLLGLAVLMIVVMGLMALLFNSLESHFNREQVASTPLLDTAQIPPGPRLQATPAKELTEVKEWETQMLESYEWIDQDTGVFRIPIERAIDIIAENGLPARENQ